MMDTSPQDKPAYSEQTLVRTGGAPTEDTDGKERVDKPYDGRDFVADCLANQSHGDYLGESDTDTENASLPPHRRWVWYCKHPACPKYYSAWTCKSNWLVHLSETPVHREDNTTTTREGRLELAKAWREETAFDMSEPKKLPPEWTENRTRAATATFSVRELMELR